MRRIKLLTLTLGAIFALSAIAATAAFAENPEILPKPTAEKPLKFETTSGTGEFNSEAAKIACKEDSSKGEFTSNTEGVVTIDFKGECKAEIEGSTIKCFSLGDASGTILLHAAIDLLTLHLSGGTLSLGLGVLLPSTLLHLQCGIFLLLIGGKVIGEFLGLTSGTKIKTTEEKELNFGATGTKQEFTECVEPKSICPGSWTLYIEITAGKRITGSEKTSEKVKIGSEAAFDF